MSSVTLVSNLQISAPLCEINHSVCKMALLCLSAGTTLLATQMLCLREWSSMRPKSEPWIPAVQLFTTRHNETFLLTSLFTVTVQCDSAAFIRVHFFFSFLGIILCTSSSDAFPKSRTFLSQTNVLEPFEALNQAKSTFTSVNLR